MRKIDIVMEIWKTERKFFFYGYEVCNNTGIEFFEVITEFDLSAAVKVIIGEDLFGGCYEENVGTFIDGRYTEAEMELKMLEWDSTLEEQISTEQKSVVIGELIKGRECLRTQISKLNENGVHFRGLEEMRILEDLLEKLYCYN
ncbi:hypothetical protein B7492_06990 [Bacillus mycoides]|uniref:Uncharacterized protein n=1 Tax=Bacillus mycoides TaxID=1405 RepID=A0A1W6A585_BACMY|nr:hypothetical protein [Bacillus mycoides]ARJ20993.1 hypothetical protein B7492_06990 [Bacillus mycoides]